MKTKRKLIDGALTDVPDDAPDDAPDAEVTDLATLAERAADLSTAYVEQIDASWLKGVAIERIVPLADGQGIRGVFLGAGPPVEVSDPVTGEVRPLGTWRFQVAPDVVIRLLDSARLKSDLSAFHTDGSVRLRVMRLGQKKTNRGRNVTDYIVARETQS
jgi:hypothetical protein